MKLKRRKHDSHRDDRPRWIWQLVWTDPASGREQSQLIGYYAHARDRWTPPGGRLRRLSERDAIAERNRKATELHATAAGIVIPADRETREAWKRYCDQTGQPPGLLLERMMMLFDSEQMKRFVELCQADGLDAQVTLADLLGDWVARHESDAPESWQALTEWYQRDGCPNAGESSRRDARTTYALFEQLAPELAVKWQHLNRDDALVFQNRLARKYAPMTVRKHIANMRKLWNGCKRLWVHGNPWSELRLPKIISSDDAWHYFTAVEVGKLLAAADLFWKARIRLTWKSALRPGEIDHLRIQDVDWDEARVRVRIHKADESTLAYSPKDKDSRTVPIDAETLGLLQRLRARSAPGNPYVFVTERRWRQALAIQKAGKWTDGIELINGKSKRFGGIVKAAGLKSLDDIPLHFYALRKTCCCDMLTAGVPTHEVQALLGHSDVRTTLTWYAKVNRKDAERRIREAQTRAS